MSTDSTTQTVLTVSELTLLVQELLENALPSVWVRGEISDFSRPRSGHCYFTLKDDQAQLRAVVWRSTASRLRFDLHDGMEVLCGGGLNVYPPRGSYQLIVRQIEPAGVGALELALRRLREKLAAEGLFDPQRKQPLPAFPRRIAVVTSPTGAALRDFLQVLRRRWTAVEVLVVPTRVQGEGAAGEIAAAIRNANRLRPRMDVMVVTRGGGSLEDLWAFNEEPVVRAIAASKIPIVSAVGHEIDVTLSDMAADLRALTPSEAAERVVPSRDEIRSRLRSLRGRLGNVLQHRLRHWRGRVDRLAGSRSLRRPFDVLLALRRRVDELDARQERAIRGRLESAEARVNSLAGRLESLSPLGVLSRGYSLTQRLPEGALLRDAADLKAGDRVRSRLQRGEFVSVVEEIVEEITESTGET